MPLVSLLWVSKSVWSFCPNSLEANPKIACCWAKENPAPAPLENGEEALQKTWLHASVEGMWDPSTSYPDCLHAQLSLWNPWSCHSVFQGLSRVSWHSWYMSSLPTLQMGFSALLCWMHTSNCFHLPESWWGLFSTDILLQFWHPFTNLLVILQSFIKLLSCTAILNFQRKGVEGT